ncbi:MAG: TetR/AcrR family transcriptional regulator C-terminal domain-containing protein [Actinomycetota bacterium]
MSTRNQPRPPTAPERPATTVTDQPSERSTRAGLSRAQIVEAALALLDREGLDGLTMRRLGQELGVGTMTVYGYFRSKDELLDAVIDAGAERIALEPPAGSWKAQLRELLLSLRGTLVKHPGVIELRFKRPIVSPGALELTEAAMQILREAGFSSRTAARAYRILFIYTFGFSAFGPGEQSRADSERTEAAIGALPPDRYPALSAAADEAAAAMADQTLFEFGLNLLLDSVESLQADGSRDR